MLHYEFIPEGHTVNGEKYIKILCHLMDAVSRKYQEKRERKS
jgi:hypothetical protein